MTEEWRVWSLVARLGITVVITLLAALLAGIWLDGLLGTRPILTLVMSLSASVVAIVNCYKMVTLELKRVAPRGHEPGSAKPDHHEDESERSAIGSDRAAPNQD